MPALSLSRADFFLLLAPGFGILARDLHILMKTRDMEYNKRNENGWGLTNYRGKVSFSFDYDGQHYSFTDLPVSYGKLFLCYDHWEMPIKGTRGKFTLCGRYAARWNEKTQEYDAPARLRFQEMCTDYLYIQVSERDTIKGHGRLITEYIPAVSA